MGEMCSVRPTATEGPACESERDSPPLTPPKHIQNPRPKTPVTALGNMFSAILSPVLLSAPQALTNQPSLSPRPFLPRPARSVCYPEIEKRISAPTAPVVWELFCFLPPSGGRRCIMHRQITLTSLFSMFAASAAMHDASPPNGDPMRRSIPPSCCPAPRPHPAHLISRQRQSDNRSNPNAFVHPAPAGRGANRVRATGPPAFPQCNTMKTQPKLDNWVRFAKNYGEHAAPVVLASRPHHLQPPPPIPVSCSLVC